MPKVDLRESFDMETRNKYTKVDCGIQLSVEGKELPSMSVLGAALEDAILMIQDRVAESYKVVPPRENPPAPNPQDGAQPATQPVQPTPSYS